MFQTEASRERWTVRIALAAFAISVLALFFTFKQWRAAERSAKAAEASASTASQALELSQRAYVGIGNISVFCQVCKHPNKISVPSKFPPEANAAILVDMFNYGKTPAYEIEMNITRHSEIGQRLPLDFDFAEDADAGANTGILEPNPTTPLQIKLPMRVEDILLARGQVPVQGPKGQIGAEYLYIYGHISYTDIFHRRRTLLFCREYIGPTETIPENCSRCSTHEGELDSFSPKKFTHPPSFAPPRFYPPEPPSSSPFPKREK